MITLKLVYVKQKHAYEYKFVLADNFTCISYGEILGTVSPEIIEKMPKSN